MKGLPRYDGEHSADREASATKGNMKKILVLAFVASLAFAQSPGTDEPVRHSAATVAHIHDSMLDPASFVLDGAYVTKPNKRGNVSFCYAFRSHNAMGGYAEGRAVEDGDDHNRLSIYNHDDEYGKFQGYDVGWIAPCKEKNIDRDITGEVSPLATALYRKSR